MSEVDPVSQRFQAATAVLKDLNAWLERKGVDPPSCVKERMTWFVMDAEEYYRMWKSWGFGDPRKADEMRDIEYSAIRKVQPGWKPKGK